MEYYNKIAKSYNKLHKKEQLEKAKIILKHLIPFIKRTTQRNFSLPYLVRERKNFQSNKEKNLTQTTNKKLLLLDIGAGTGISTKLFVKYCDCVALEPSEKLLKQIKNKKIKKIIAKAENLPFKKNTFDIIIAVTSLHHTNLKKAIKEINRVAKPNAQIAISFLKKSKKLTEIKKLLKSYKKINSEKDIIFIKNKNLL